MKGGGNVVLTIRTAAHGVIVKRVNNTSEAVEVLRKLAADGIKCIRWEIANGKAC